MTFHSLYYQDYFKTRVDINAAWIVGMKKKKNVCKTGDIYST